MDPISYDIYPDDHRQPEGASATWPYTGATISRTSSPNNGNSLSHTLGLIRFSVAACTPAVSIFLEIESFG